MTHWLCILKPYFFKLGRKVELGLAKAVARELIDQNQELIENRDSYATLIGFIKPGVVAENPYLATITQHYRVLDRHMQISLNQLVKDAATRVKKKMDKDTKVILNLSGDSNRLVPMTNNHCEASFSHVKELHQKFAPMDKEYKAELAQARQNMIGQWLLEQTEADLDQSLSKIENEWRVNKKVQKRLKHRRNQDNYDILFDDQ